MAESHQTKRKIRKQEGFTLIEILVAMSLLAFGLLAVALNTVNGLKSRVDSEIHSRAMQVTSYIVEPLNRAIAINTENFIDEVKGYANGAEFDNYTIDIKSSTDIQGSDITQSPSSQLKPPFTLVFDIKYQKQDSSALQFASTHVFVPNK